MTNRSMVLLFSVSKKCRIGEAFRRGKNELVLFVHDALNRRGLVALIERGIDQGGRNSRIVQLAGLILHQRDERRYHDGGAGQVRAGN